MSIGDRIADYEITARIGAGGMGEVFRARDTRLGRDVAIKVLPPHLADDADRKDRFEREARFLGALNHPNIGGIYGFVSAEGVNGLALEFIDGPGLSDKIASGPLPIGETLVIARQIATALDAAHERGIIHRDLKPANIKIAADGLVKVLDFGIAKALMPPGDAAATRTADGTQAGIVLGTAGYMSPEQARGVEVDRRTDIWAFGCIVFEMLTGRAAFSGSTTMDTITAVLHADPDWSRLPSNTPPLVQRMLRRCLQKDTRHRQRDIADAAADLDDAKTTGAQSGEAGSPRWPGWIAAAIAGGAVMAAALFMSRGPAPAPAARPKATLEQMTFDAGVSMMPALSPDGKLLVYASNRAGHGDLDLWVQQTTGGAPIRLTDDPADDQQPSFSPDASQIVFRSERGGGGVYVVPALGGAARRLADGGRSPRFSPDGRQIAYWTGSWRGNAVNVSGSVFTLDLSGGQPTRLLPAFYGVQEPLWSPDGKSLIVVARETMASAADLYWLRLDSATAVKTGALDRNQLREDVALQSLSSTILGAWTRDGVLMSASSGLWRLPISQESGLTAEPQQMTVGGRRHVYGTADNGGGIVFAIAEAPRVIERAPLNNDGPAELIYTDGRSGSSRPSQTPDGSRIVYDRRGPKFAEIWMKERGVADRMVLRATERAINMVISPDGARVAYTTVGSNGSDGEGYMIKVDGGVPTRLCVECTLWGFLSDSTSILVTNDRSGRLDALDVRTGDLRVILEASSPVDRPHISPDDHRIAFNVGGQQWIAAIYADRPTPQTEWNRVDQDTDAARACGWSADSQTAYLLLDTDGFRCLWGQRVDPRTGALLGGPFAVRHFHKTVTHEFSTSFGNAISADGFLYGGGNLKANLWRLTLSAR